MLEFSWEVDDEDIGLTAEELLKKRFQCSSSLIKEIRLRGELIINGRKALMKTPLHLFDEVYARPPIKETAPLCFPEDQQPSFLNDWIIVLSKKANQVVHPCLNKEIQDLCSLISATPLHPVNRLDRDTSGLVIIARNGHAHYRLSKEKIDKEYIAILHGRLPKKTGRIKIGITRDPLSIIERIPHIDGKESETEWIEIAYSNKANLSLVRFKLHTGRTHQIRVHSLWMACPLLGDTMYGLDKLQLCLDRDHIATKYRSSARELLATNQNQEVNLEINRQALHAAYLSFTDPLSKKRIVLNDPLPSDMQRIIQKFF